MSGIVCLAVLVGLYLVFGWAGVLIGAAVLLAVMLALARWQLEREDAELIRRAQGRSLGGIDRRPNDWWKNS